MESGSAVVGKEERKKYRIYVEEYVLSYLRRESDSLELSEIYFYGSRRENGRKFYVYGAGRDREIAAFAEYELLSELVCRLTQAGPVFLVREPDGECRTNSFEVFYDNNEAMQNYLLEWTSSTGRRRNADKKDRLEKLPVPAVFPEEEKRRTPHRAMSVQVCLILIALVAIVIASTDSYDKMEELNRSAREVFFAIENQEAEEIQSTGEREIVVERDSDPIRETLRETDAGEAMEETKAEAESGEASEETKPAAESGETLEETKPAAESGEASEETKPAAESGETPEETKQEAESGETSEETKAEAESGEAAGETKQEVNSSEAAEEVQQEENEEALSRSITRYYEVEQGDTLYTISQKIYGDLSHVGRICKENEITDPDKIRSGQRIILP